MSLKWSAIPEKNRHIAEAISTSGSSSARPFSLLKICYPALIILYDIFPVNRINLTNYKQAGKGGVNSVSRAVFWLDHEEFLR